jgi:flagellar motor switch/type III secretory pathway protein FliN
MAAALAVPQPPAELLSAAARQQVGWLPCRLQAEISLRGFTVGDLLRLEVGAIVDSGVAVESDIAVRVNGASVGSAKLELAGSHLAVRLAELI